MSRHKRQQAWWQMVKRCTDPEHQYWRYYGGRGITVDPVWLDFERYYADTGEPPTDKHTLDRIDNEKGYGPDNWRWATKAEQSQNRRYCHHLTFNGKTQTASEWARELGMKVETVIWRVKAGWAVEDILKPDAGDYHTGLVLTAFGKTQPLKAWVQETGLQRTTITARIKRGWSVEEALSVPCN